MKTNIHGLCQRAGILTAYQLQVKTGLSPSQAARLYLDKVEAISLSVLEKLLTVLNCDPNAIFGWQSAEIPADVQATSASSQTAPPLAPEPAKIELEKTARLSTSQAARLIGLSPRQTRRLAETGKIKGERNERGEWSFLESDLIEYQNK